MAVEQWLAEAAGGLAPEAKSKVEREMSERPEMTHEDPKVAKARLEKQYLTVKDAEKLRDSERQARVMHRFVSWGLGLWSALGLYLMATSKAPDELAGQVVAPIMALIIYSATRPNVAKLRPKGLRHLYLIYFGLLFLQIPIAFSFTASSSDLRLFLWLTLGLGLLAAYSEMQAFEKRYAATFS